MPYDEGLTERWTNYVMKIECKVCGEPIYAHREDARADIEHLIPLNDLGPSSSIRELRDALTWLEHEGKYCDYHAEQGGSE